MTDTRHGLIDHPAWMTDAECAGINPDVMYPATIDGEREAIAICRRCEVQSTCLAYALTNRERFGVWGGLTAYQRRRILRGKTAGPLIANLTDIGAFR